MFFLASHVRIHKSLSEQAVDHVAEGLEGHLQQGVAAFADGADTVVGLVVGPLRVGQFAALGFLERDEQHGLLARGQGGGVGDTS
jgi:hypothetical protein